MSTNPYEGMVWNGKAWTKDGEVQKLTLWQRNKPLTIALVAGFVVLAGLTQWAWSTWF